MKNLFVGFVLWVYNLLSAFCYRLIVGRDLEEVSTRWGQFTDDWSNSLISRCGFRYARLFVHTVPHNKLRLFIDLPEQGLCVSATAIDSLREHAWLRSLQFPIRSLVSMHDSAKDGLIIWLRWQNRYLTYYGVGTTRPNLAIARLQEFLDQNFSPHFMLQELIEVMISERVPQFLMAVLVKDCLERLRQHPMDSVCPDDCLTKLLEFLADNTWNGFDELRRECVLIAHARIAILEQAPHVEKLLAVASDANPWKKFNLKGILGGAGPLVPEPNT
jgi:hypothetical protein